MKANKFLSITLLAGVLTLSACGSKDGDSVSDDIESTSTGPVYTITGEEYSALRTKFLSPSIFINGNFKMTIEFQGASVTDKFANGKFDGYLGGEHCVLDIQTSTYDASTYDATFDRYYYDTDDGKWYKSTVTDSLKDLYDVTFMYFDVMPDSFDDLTYSEETHSYTGSKTVEGEKYSTEFSVKDGALISVSLTPKAISSSAAVPRI